LEILKCSSGNTQGVKIHYRAEGMAQVVEYLPGKLKMQSSNLKTSKTNKRPHFSQFLTTWETEITGLVQVQPGQNIIETPISTTTKTTGHDAAPLPPQLCSCVGSISRTIAVQVGPQQKLETLYQN
jgi:hypothetical protein